VEHCSIAAAQEFGVVLEVIITYGQHIAYLFAGVGLDNLGFGPGHPYLGCFVEVLSKTDGCLP